MDARSRPRRLERQRMDTPIFGELGVECRAHHVALAHQHRLAAVARQHNGARAHVHDARCADADSGLAGALLTLSTVLSTSAACVTVDGDDNDGSGGPSDYVCINEACDESTKTRAAARRRTTASQRAGAALRE